MASAKWTKLTTWIIRLATFLPFIYWVAGIFLDWHGVEPLVKINTQSGYVVLVLLLINLAIGTIHALKWFRIENYRFLLMRRRWLGVACGLYVIMHFMTYLAKESFLPKGWEQIVTKNYLIAGSLSMIILLLMTLTSNDYSIRILKKNWKRLHNLVHLASVTVLFHIFLIEKANLLLLAMMVAPVCLLQILRLIKKGSHGS